MIIDLFFLCVWVLSIHLIQDSYFQDRFLADQLIDEPILPLLRAESIYLNQLTHISLSKKQHLRLGDVSVSQRFINIIPIVTFPTIYCSLLYITYVGIGSYIFVVFINMFFAYYVIYPVFKLIYGGFRASFMDHVSQYRYITWQLGQVRMWASGYFLFTQLATFIQEKRIQERLKKALHLHLPPATSILENLSRIYPVQIEMAEIVRYKQIIFDSSPFYQTYGMLEKINFDANVINAEFESLIISKRVSKGLLAQIQAQGQIPRKFFGTYPSGTRAPSTLIFLPPCSRYRTLDIGFMEVLSEKLQTYRRFDAWLIGFFTLWHLCLYAFFQLYVGPPTHLYQELGPWTIQPWRGSLRVYQSYSYACLRQYFGFRYIDFEMRRLRALHYIDPLWSPGLDRLFLDKLFIDVFLHLGPYFTLRYELYERFYNIYPSFLRDFRIKSLHKRDFVNFRTWGKYKETKRHTDEIYLFRLRFLRYQQTRFSRFIYRWFDTYRHKRYLSSAKQNPFYSENLEPIYSFYESQGNLFHVHRIDEMIGQMKNNFLIPTYSFFNFWFLYSIRICLNLCFDKIYIFEKTTKLENLIYIILIQQVAFLRNLLKTKTVTTKRSKKQQVEDQQIPLDIYDAEFGLWFKFTIKFKLSSLRIQRSRFLRQPFFFLSTRYYEMDVDFDSILQSSLKFCSEEESLQYNFFLRRYQEFMYDNALDLHVALLTLLFVFKSCWILIKSLEIRLFVSPKLIKKLSLESYHIFTNLPYLLDMVPRHVVSFYVSFSMFIDRCLCPTYFYCLFPYPASQERLYNKLLIAVVDHTNLRRRNILKIINDRIVIRNEECEVMNTKILFRYCYYYWIGELITYSRHDNLEMYAPLKQLDRAAQREEFKMDHQFIIKLDHWSENCSLYVSPLYLQKLFSITLLCQLGRQDLAIDNRLPDGIKYNSLHFGRLFIYFSNCIEIYEKSSDFSLKKTLKSL